MIRFNLWRNSPDGIRRRERKYASEYMERLSGVPPKFDYGLDHIFLENKKGNPLSILENFVSDWWKDPEKKMNFRNYAKPKVSVENGYVKFQSLLGGSKARFAYVRQPKWRSGHNICIIMLKHWNSDPTKYFRGINFIRRTMLPISTGLFLPSYQYHIGDKKKKNRHHHTLGPNIGLTIKRVWQDVLDLQYFGNWLKEHEGFDQVGLFPYSVGSLRGILAALFAQDIFDFGVFHYIADDYTESFMNGISTKPEASVIREHISEDKLRKIWSVISPGNYEYYLNRLSRNDKLGGFRIVQANYDLVFGEDNVRRLTKKIKDKAPDVEVYEGNFGHITMTEVENAFSVMIKDLKFIYKNTGLNYF